SDIVCTTTTACIAHGSMTNAATWQGGSLPLASSLEMTWDGVSWTSVPAFGATVLGGGVAAASCPPTIACIGVGAWWDPAQSRYRTLAVPLNAPVPAAPTI